MPANNSCESRISVGRRTIFCLLLSAALLGALSLAGCPGRQRKPVAQQSVADLQKRAEPESTLKAEFGKARILWSDKKGARVMDALFKEATASQTGKNAALELKTVKANLYRDGKLVSIMVAPRIVADSKTREVRASGGVRVTSTTDGGTAMSDELLWSAKDDKISGTGGVKMQKGNMSITARSFEADTSLKKAHFTDAVLGLE
jgi:hypothetical protein